MINFVGVVSLQSNYSVFHSGFVDMCVKHIPSPCEAARKKVGRTVIGSHVICHVTSSCRWSIPILVH